MAEKYVLYSYWRSSCSWRVRISLEWKGIPYEYRAVHLLNGGGEHFKDEYTTLNPNQRLPTLVVDGKTLPQSVAILEFLEETHPEKPLLPIDPFARAQIKATEEVPEDQRVAKKQAWGRFWIERGFEALERELAKTAATYCFGNEVTLADLYLQPQVYNANRVGVDMTKYPIISRISASLETVPAFQKAHPSQQPDAVN
ncbi:hypothetical protein PC116_g8453 [Phytophthora cactorum]|uniref:maleylacetoacetate isomerase n=1 Tax=Phytophthora cactorum TaxID=29920 RepID=A0A8T1L4V8_9STRA|nr:hypothetical protein PC114_g6154 [Phytophthora cactorum]KAG2948789.1 hypothetical protein PC117_g5742 [Phytophthora cactorum]KAG3095927.1 hypothetical protein PC122_g5100 [Phytophthora cactorum]KAG4243700.1 hypothetical protein PC116_g8453 [Phytophthora cactorum]